MITGQEYQLSLRFPWLQICHTAVPFPASTLFWPSWLDHQHGQHAWPGWPQARGFGLLCEQRRSGSFDEADRG